MPSNPSMQPRLPAPVPAHERGLTLVEILVVLAIIAIMAAIIVPNVVNRPDQARATTARSDIQSIAAALKIYRLDNGDYPSTAQGLQALVSRPSGEPAAAGWTHPYLDTMPQDPWGHPYVYRSPGQDGSGFELSSYGKDGRPGGEGVSADIVISAH